MTSLSSAVLFKFALQFMRNDSSISSSIQFTRNFLYLAYLLLEPIQYLLVLLFPAGMIGSYDSKANRSLHIIVQGSYATHQNQAYRLYIFLKY
jgi:hypothetical protein